MNFKTITFKLKTAYVNLWVSQKDDIIQGHPTTISC